MINTATPEDIRVLISACRKMGKDFSEVADRHGILLTEERLREIQASLLGDLAGMLETTSAGRWTETEHKNPNTEDVRVGIAVRLRQLEQATRKVGWRKG
jgi:hypothetical protein